MSNLFTLIQVTPNPHNQDNKPEVVQVICKCPACNGTGSFKTAKGYHGSSADEFIINDCQRCAGSGELKAYIVIRWMPR